MSVLLCNSGSGFGVLGGEAGRLGYGCLVFLVSPDRLGDLPDLDVGVDVVWGVLLEPGSVGEFKGLVGGCGDVDFVVVRSVGDVDVDRAVVLDGRVDLLLLGGGDVVDYVLARECGERGVGVGFDLKELLDSRGYRRSLLVRRFRKDVEVLGKYGCSVVPSLLCRDRFDVKAPRDFRSLLGVFGFDVGLFGDSREFILDRVSYNRRGGSSGFVEPGIEVVDDED
ncbi:hypothetical protein [Methanonatronarchaeum sp. AMET-Sl]|uniref:hypothetical protein n=1 Tax=Methanonatronarchaeum sp. AMET-Sl TaxID=3037654 RepID=UPI00244DA34C|nr:hypothetical protein [Methanonatronarchaeum sp. AMET-Sl]WGI16900.1 hypothetical protein QEN48_05220 [Methanonatronarchaeum sp. AMET-Sl]